MNELNSIKKDKMEFLLLKSPVNKMVETSPKMHEVIIIGAGASGLMCAIEAGKRGRKVLLLDHSEKPAQKVLISGGGKCNFSNYNVSTENYISQNQHFCKSALSRYTQRDFIELLLKHNISFEEREHGQLFCEQKATAISEMLLKECREAEVELQFGITISNVEQDENKKFKLSVSSGELICDSLVIATGGLSIPESGASSFGYKLAEKFNIDVIPPKPGLVPLTYKPKDKDRFVDLSGISVYSEVSNPDISFKENILFTHRGVSGPAILQISSYWQAEQEISINLLPEINPLSIFKEQQKSHAKKMLKNFFGEFLPKRLVSIFLTDDIIEKHLQEISHKHFANIANIFQNWIFVPNGTEGYRTAEVTVGGIDCNEISSKTMESKKIEGLFFTGEILDVTGWLGGYNLQWAWSSGWSAGQYV